jgi:hypothetical protein
MFLPTVPSNCVEQTITNCPPGYTVSDLGECIPCSIGSYSSGGHDATCQFCSAGRYSSITGSSACVDCSEGKRSNGGTGGIIGGGSVGGADGSTDCVDCEIGKFSSTSSSITGTCTLCVPGQYTNKVGSKKCKLCDSGQYDSKGELGGGSTQCTHCATGKYASDEGALLCSSCTPGTYASTTGNSYCTKCHLGQYADSKLSTSCKKCPIAENKYVKMSDGSINETGIGGVDCIFIDTRAKDEDPFLIDTGVIILIVLSSVFLIMVGIIMMVWIVRQRKRRLARMVNPNFPDSTTEMIATSNEITPASIINEQFLSHDLDHDGHIDATELKNLIEEIIGKYYFFRSFFFPFVLISLLKK